MRTELRTELEYAVNEAEQLLYENGIKHSERDNLALKDMIQKAKEALAGKGFPFSNKREFWNRQEEDLFQFALHRYTMVPSYFSKEKGFTTYGLADAIEWYKNLPERHRQEASNVRLQVRTFDDDRFNFFLSEEEIELLRDKVQTDPFFKEQYQNIKMIADEANLEQRERWYQANFEPDDYTMLSQEMDLWSKTGNGADFFTPEDTKSARISMELPVVENETDGLGHIWVRDFILKAADGTIITIPFNDDKMEQSLYLENKNNDFIARWNYKHQIPLVGRLGYTLSFEAKQEGKLKEGFVTRIQFLNEDEQVIGNYEYLFNKKSWIPSSSYNLSMQCDAFVYLMTSDLTYAQKAKVEMLHHLNDFCQGACYWLLYNARPEGNDAYGAVQAGRNMGSLAVAYACIKNADVFTKEEKEKFYELVDFELHYALDLRDRTAMSFEEAQCGSSNWQTDMCIGVSMLMFALEDFPHRLNWIDNAYAVLYGQLTNNLNPDGSWPESIRYHHATLERFATYARVLKRVMGIDWFKETRLLEMFRFGVMMQTPAYEYFDGYISTPPFGDHKLSAGEEFVLYGIYLREAAEVDPLLADQMYLTWCAAGKKTKRLFGESIIVENFLNQPNYQLQQVQELSLLSTKNFPDSGVTIFRNQLDNNNTDFLAVMSSKKRIGHGHLDQGSFVLFKNSVPMIMDSGIEGYFDVSTPWHISSYSHACLLFVTEKMNKDVHTGFINLSAGNYTKEQGYLDTPFQSKVLLCELGDEKDIIQIEIEQIEGPGKQIRTIEMDKRNRTWKVQDEVENYQGEILFSLPLVAKEVKIDGDTIHVEGYYDTNLEIKIETHYSSIHLEKGRTTKLYPSEETIQYLQMLRIHAMSKDGISITMK